MFFLLSGGRLERNKASHDNISWTCIFKQKKSSLWANVVEVQGMGMNKTSGIKYDDFQKYAVKPLYSNRGTKLLLI